MAMSYGDALKVLAGLRDVAERASDDEQIAFLKFCLVNASWSRGQYLQDLWAAYESRERRDGFFVEFGATNGVKYSNSYALETRLGWSGVVAEPARVWRQALHQNRGCFIDERCVWTTTGQTLMFNQPGIAAHSTIDSYSNSDNLAATRVDGLRYKVQTVSLLDLLGSWNAPRRIDYLSIDTEGSEFDILQAFDFSAYDIRTLSVEHNHTPKRREIFELLTARGYRRKFEALSNIDDWYVRTD